MRDFDLKGIKRDRKKLDKVLKKESLANDGDLLLMNRLSAPVVEDLSSDVETSHALFDVSGHQARDSAIASQIAEDVPDSSESLALITALQPLDHVYTEVSGIDNLTGRQIRAIIPPAEDPAHSPEIKSQTAHGRNKNGAATPEPDGKSSAKEPASVILLPGDIYRPTVLEWLVQNIFTPRLAAAATLIFALLAPLWALYSIGTFYYLSDEDEGSPVPQRVVWTTASSPREVAMTFTELDKSDRVDVVEFGTTMMLNIVRSYPVALTVDGTTVPVNVLDATVGEMLETEGVEFSKDDILSLELDHILEEDDELIIRRVTYKERSPVTKILPFEKDMKPSPFISEGREIILSEGADGLSELYYLDRYIDGEYDSSSLLGEVIVEEPVSAYVLIGDPLAAASTLEISNYSNFADIELVDGVPSKFIDIIPDAVCTAYSFGPKAFGASGMRLIQGFVATNPDIIPYGTLMYIASSRFTYGWAIAADCGTAMFEGYVDIDCYFETYNESVIFGKKLMDVYIIGQLTQAELEEYAANGMFYSRVPLSAESPE